MKNKIPIYLIYIRSAFGLIIPIIAYLYGEQSVPIVVSLVILGLLADIFDGIIARKLNVSTKNLRIIDSVVDRIFWVLVLLACYLIYPIYIKEIIGILAFVLSMDMLVFVVSLIRFKKLPSPHNLLTKLWGILLAISVVEIIISGQSYLFGIMIAIGIISRIDSLLIYLILNKWDHDIPTCYHAYLLAQEKSIKRHKLFNG
jgi:CDP-diacylglycerol--glycerol-3-phosphate 3-phosphatidyltransferase